MARLAEERLILTEGYGDNWKKLREKQDVNRQAQARNTSQNIEILLE
jgi:hypothetical protein